MPFEQQPSPLADVILAQTYNAQWFSGSTNELKITAAIAAAVADGAKYVLVPKNMYPYIAANVTFNSAVRIIREGNLTDQFDVMAYGADNTGVNESLTAFQTAATHAGVYKGIVYVPGGSYKITGTITLADNTKFYAAGATLTQNQSLIPLIYAVNCTNIEVNGGKYIGVGSSTAFSDSNAGLIYFGITASNYGQDVKVVNVEVSNASTGISIIRAKRAYVLNSYVHNFYLYAILTSQCQQWWVLNNRIIDSDQAGAASSYGFQATGDDAGGFACKDGLFAFNDVENIPSWDGLMTHDCDGMIIHANHFRNVRQAIDIGHLQSTNVIKKLVITDNIITLTQTNTWGVGSAPHGGIRVEGYDATHRVQGVVVKNNHTYDYNRLTTGAYSGTVGGYIASHADDVVFEGNLLINVGTFISVTGIHLIGTLNRVVVNGNSVQGTMSAGGIRTTGATIDNLTVQNNQITQTTASDNAILLATSSVITRYSEKGTITNSTTPFTISSSTVGYDGNNGRVSADRGDNNVTIGITEAENQRFATVLTANRTVTLPTGWLGLHYRIIRTGLGAFTLDVGGLKTIPAGTAAFVDVTHDGTAFRLTGYGTL